MRKKKREKSAWKEIIGIAALAAITCYYAFAGRRDTVNAQEESLKLISAVEQMQKAQLDYFLKKGRYAENLAELSSAAAEAGTKLDFLPPGSSGTSQAIAEKNGWDYEARIYRSSETFGISAVYTEGRFKNSGFFYNFQGINDEPAGELMCKEPSNVPRSDYCKNIMGYSGLFSYRPEYRTYKKVADFEDITGDADPNNSGQTQDSKRKPQKGQTESNAFPLIL